MSLTIGGMIVLVLSFVARTAGLDFHIPGEQIDTSIATIGQVLGLLMAWYGRYRQGGITWYGRKA